MGAPELKAEIIANIEAATGNDLPAISEDVWGAVAEAIIDEALGASIGFEATCTADEAVGDLVYLSGAGAVRRANPEDMAKMPAVGIITTKPTTTTCTVQALGIIVTSGLTPSPRCFVSGAGRVSPAPPIPEPGHYALIQPIGAAIDASHLLLLPSLAMTRVRT